MNGEPASSSGDVDKIAYEELPRALYISAGDIRFVVSRYLEIEDRLDTDSTNAPAWRLDMIDRLAQLLQQLEAHMEHYRHGAYRDLRGDTNG